MPKDPAVRSTSDVAAALREWAVCHPAIRKVIVFGSVARGTATRHSDLDIAVIADTDRRFVDRPLDFTDVHDVAPIGIELLVYTPEEFDRNRRRPFFRRIMQEGEVVYER